MSDLRSTSGTSEGQSRRGCRASVRPRASRPRAEGHRLRPNDSRGPAADIQVIEHRENTIAGKEVIKKLPGQKKAENITLKRGTTDSPKLWEWHKKGMEGKIDEARKNASIVLFDYAGGEIRRFNLTNCWPSKVSSCRPAASCHGRAGSHRASPQ